MINERLFGSPISGKVKKKLEDRQRVAGELAFGDSIEAVYPDKDGNNQADLSSRTPFIRMWTSVKLYGSEKFSEILSEISTFSTAEDLGLTDEEFEKQLYEINKGVIEDTEREEKFNEATITKIDGKYYLVGKGLREQISYDSKTYILGDYNYQANYSSIDDDNNSFFPQELKNNQLLKPQAGITSLTSETRGLKEPTKTTTVSFIVHNFEDFDNIYNRYFLKPGAKIFVDFGWSSVKNLYNPNDLINSTNILEYLYGDSTNIVPGYEDEDGNIVEERNEVDGQVTLNQGDLEVIQGIVIDYSAKVTTNGSVECSVTLISQNAALLNFKVDTTLKNHIEDVLTRTTLILGLEATLNDEQSVSPEITADTLQILQTPNVEDSEYDKNITKLSITQFGGNEFTPKNNSIRTGIFVDNINADDIYVCWGFIEDVIFNANFGFGTSGNDINQGTNFRVRMDSSNSFTTWDKIFKQRQKSLSKVPEQPPTFVFPEWWGASDPDDGGAGSYNYFNKKYPRLHYQSDNHTEIDEDKGRIPVREVFVNVESVKNAFEQNDSVKKVLNQLLSDINKDSDGVFDWKIISSNQSDSELQIIDNNRPDVNQRILDSGITDSSENNEDLEPDAFKNLFTFNIMSPNSIVKDYNLDFKIPTDNIGNMNAILGMSHENTIFPVSDDVYEAIESINVDRDSLDIIYQPDTSGFRASQINARENKKANDFDVYGGAKNLIDSNIYKTSAIRNVDDIIGPGGVPNEPNTQKQSSDEILKEPTPTSIKKEEQNKLLEQNIKLTVQKGNKIATTFKEYFKLREYQNIVLKKKPILLPYTLSLTTYGIGSIQPGDTFRVDYLPKQHFKRTFLQTMSVSNTVNSDGWYTTLETAYRPLKTTSETIVKDIDRDKVFFSPKILNNFNLLSSFKLRDKNGEKESKIEQLFPYMIKLKIKEIEVKNIDMVFTFNFKSKDDIEVDVGGDFLGYGVSPGKRVEVDTARYIDYNGEVKGIDKLGGEQYIQDNRQYVGYNGVQSIIPPLVKLTNQSQYFLVVQKTKFFITDNEDIVKNFDFPLRTATPGQGYSA